MNFATLFDGGPITSEKINTALLLLVLVFVLFSAFWGLIRGFKKTGFRAIWLVLTAVILLFVTPLITKVILDVNISSFGLEFEGIKVTTLNEFFATYLDSLGYGTLSNTVALEMIQKLPFIVINVILFVLLFWIFKILLYPIWAIISAIAIQKRLPNGDKVKKHRLVGMLVGVVLGLFISSITLMPVLGTIRLAGKIDKDTDNMTTNNGGVISEMLGAEYAPYLQNFDSYTANQIFRYTGLEFVSNITYNQLTTVRIGGERVNLENELATGIAIYNIASDISKNFDMNNLTQPQINTLLTKVDLLIDTVFKSGLFKSIGSSATPYIIEEVNNENSNLQIIPTTNNANLDLLIKESIEALEDLDFLKLQQDLKHVTNIIRTLNNLPVPNSNATQSLIVLANTPGALDGLNTISDYKSITQLLSPQSVTSIVNDLFSIQVSGKTTPLILNYALNELAVTLNIPNFNATETPNITSEQLKQTFSGVLNTTLAIFNSLDESKDYYITNSTLPSVGKLLDVIVNYAGLTEQNYANLVSHGVTKLQSLVLELDTNSIPATIVANLQSAIANISTLKDANNALKNDFEQEFTKINTIFNDAVLIYDTFTTIDTLDFAKVGKILDTLKSTKLLGNQINSIVANAIDYGLTQLDANTLPFDVTPIITQLKTNITQKTFTWENEFDIIGDFVSYLLNAVEDENYFNDILTNGAISDLGKQIDKLKPSVLIGDSINNLIIKVVDFAIDALSPQQKIQFEPTINLIVQNINNSSQTVLWENELSNIANVIQTATTQPLPPIGTLGQMLDTITTNSQIITKPVINSLLPVLIEPLLSSAPQDIINVILSKLNDIVSYEQELVAINTFMSSLQTLISNPQSINPVDLGKTLDDYSNPSSENYSVIVKAISPNVVELLLGKIMPDENSTDTKDILIRTILTPAIDKIQNIESYELELGILANLQNIDLNNISSLGPMLDEIKQNSKLLDHAPNIMLNLILDQTIDSESDLQIKSVLTQIKSNALNLIETNAITYTQTIANLNDFKTKMTQINQQLQTPAFDEQVVGQLFNDIKSIQIVGTEIVASLANNVVDTFIAQLEQHLPATQQNIDNLQTVKQDIETNKLNTNYDYINVFSQIKQNLV